MKVLLPLLLASAAAHAEKAWVFEPGQALVSVELGPARARINAVSPALTGLVRELDGGALRAEVRLGVLSFTTGNPAHDQRLHAEGNAAQFPEVVFEGVSGSPRDGTVQLRGTLTFHGVSRQLSVPVAVVRAGEMIFAHTTLTLHLRDFGFALPPGVPDELRIDLDAGLRPEGAIARRG